MAVEFYDIAYGFICVIQFWEVINVSFYFSPSDQPVVCCLLDAKSSSSFNVYENAKGQTPTKLIVHV